MKKLKHIVFGFLLALILSVLSLFTPTDAFADEQITLPIISYDVSADSGESSGRQLVIGPDNNIWFLVDVARSTTGEEGVIGNITTTGIVSKFSVPGISGASQMVFDKAGNIWYTQTSANKIGKMSPQGVITEYQLPSGRCMRPNDITLGPDGNMWFIQTTFETTGCIKQSFLTRITPEGVMTEFSYPGINAGNNIITGPDGNLWVSGGVEGSLIKVTTDSTYTIFDTSGFTQNLIQGKNQDFWFAQYKGATQIAHITTDGAITEYPVPNEEIIIALAVDDSGDLWFMDIFADKISRMNSQGDIISYLLPKTLKQVKDMIFGPDNNIWFVETTSGNVSQIDLSTILPTPTPTEEPTPTPTEPPAEENNGYNNGYNNEFNNEYNNGFNSGFVSEFNNGYNSGFNNNFNNGYNSGYNNGWNNGYNNNYNNGYNNGFIQE